MERKWITLLATAFLTAVILLQSAQSAPSISASPEATSHDLVARLR